MNDDLPNHIGWQLWQASRNWTETFVSGLKSNGYPGITFALANVLGHLSRNENIRQTKIASRAGLTKQAVGQFLDELEKLQLIERIPDPNDGRARLVRYTDQGKKFLKVADQIKTDIENEYSAKMGGRNLTDLKNLIDKLQ
ncbi:MAG: MarR family transcriptional regulator [Rhodospirillaceae bacterium]|jgi:DNA-binding MarR family transcriptional regulator|nr:MarR family transcriptional regulator [Rhodospirillaceae bacterium]MBT4589775.1 MarR family transcriptional regulator [Rhodospirillaceae bacterium]MBT4938322.1 MarR family transcriptional regulator [Rhodospirillaceae bacterium]MBT5940061.1 MarR family transcriptional regulator [Rhodospirillaceae bacterium]MBT7266251.1 MarR family transcriptional regulator [Rhodospirillaceae bacterium]